MSIEWSDIEANLLTALGVVRRDVVSMTATASVMSEDEFDPYFIGDCKRRYEEGRAEHAGTFESWDHWTQERFTFEMREELIDAVLYAAAKETKG